MALTLKRWQRGAVMVVVFAGLLEAVIRGAGAVDFPLYRADDDHGYAPQPNQAGQFLRKNRWEFNDRGMAIGAPWQPGRRTDVIVIGNSVIMGGNPYDQPDKVAPRLQARLGAACAVWPVATGGWSQVNELRFLERHPDIVAAADFFVWEYMAGGLEGVTPWTRETALPRHNPIWATGYLVRKALHERFPQWAPPVQPLPGVPTSKAENLARFEAMVQRLAGGTGRRPAGLIFLFPDREQLKLARRGGEWLSDRAELQRIASTHRLMLVDVAAQPQWVDAHYRDHVHPTADGNAVLVDILAQPIAQALQPAGCQVAGAAK